MKDKKILLLIPLILMAIILLSIIFYDNYNIKRINTKLKKEKAECKQELNRYKEEYLKRIVGDRK